MVTSLMKTVCGNHMKVGILVTTSHLMIKAKVINKNLIRQELAIRIKQSMIKRWSMGTEL